MQTWWSCVVQIEWKLAGCKLGGCPRHPQVFSAQAYRLLFFSSLSSRFCSCFLYTVVGNIAQRNRPFFSLSHRLGTAFGRWLELLSTILIARERKLVLMNVCEGNQTRTRVHSTEINESSCWRAPGMLFFFSPFLFGIVLCIFVSYTISLFVFFFFLILYKFAKHESFFFFF